jgi:hypothetical protein
MVISTYQVNNFLRVYGDQLRQTKVAGRPRSNPTRTPDRVSISAGGKRQAIVDQVASQIVDRITRNGPNNDMEKEVFQKLENEYGAPLSVEPEGTSELLFKVIDEENETIRSLSIEDSNILSHKLKAITKETVDQKYDIGAGEQI